MSGTNARVRGRSRVGAIVRSAMRLMQRLLSWGDRHPRRARPVVVAVFTVMLGVVGVLAYLRPSYPWDMLGYIGVAESIDTRDPVEVQRLTYAAAAAAVPDVIYRDLIGESGNDSPGYMNTNHYRRAVAADPEAFRQQLPFYAVKPLYPVLIYALGKAGLQPVIASVLLAILGYVGALLVVLAWFSRHYAPVVALGFASLVAASVPIALLARISSPDSLAVFIVVLGAFFLVELHRARLALALFSLAVLARPNTIILLLLLIGYLATWAPPRIALSARSAIVAGIIAVTAFAALSKVSGMYSFQTLFYFAQIQFLPYPAGFSSALGPVDYLSAYAVALLQFEFGFVLIGLVVIRLRAALFSVGSDVLTHVTLLVLLSLPLQWVVYPTESLRTMAPQFELLVIFLVVAAQPGIGSFTRARAQAASRDDERARGEAPLTRRLPGR
jgi:hypothetical protein